MVQQDHSQDMEKHFSSKNTAVVESIVPLERSLSSLNLSSEIHEFHVQRHYQTPDASVQQRYSYRQIYNGTSLTKQVIRETVIVNEENHEMPKAKVPYLRSHTWPARKSNSTKTSEEHEDIEFVKPANDSSIKLKNVKNERTENNETLESKHETKKKTIHSNPSESQDKPKLDRSFPLHCKLLSLLLPVALLLIALAFENVEFLNENICDYSYFSNATNQLHEFIYGQEEAISNLQKYFVHDTSCVRVVALVGGTGVGKSYTVDIVTKNMPSELHISKFVFPLYDNSNSMPGFQSPHLVILENAMEQDIQDIMNLIKSNNKRKDITFITVFNSEQVNDDLTRTTNSDEYMKKIEESFANVNSIVIGYKPLTEEILEKCITQAAKENQVKLTSSQILLIKNYLLINNSGCKGVDAKVKLFIEDVIDPKTRKMYFSIQN